MAALSGRFAADFPRWTQDQMFRLASDIERYPDFIPWCRKAEVLSEDGPERMVDNHFGAGPADLHFLSRAVAAPPERLDIAAVDGPFRSFRLVWRFAPLDGGGCRVDAEYQVEFRSFMLQRLAALVLREVERRVVRRFHDRAEALYG